MTPTLDSIAEVPIYISPVSEPAAQTTRTLAPMQLWAFLENSDFVRRDGDSYYRMDEVSLIRHDEFLEEDYQLLVDIGCKGVRDAARWFLTNPEPGVFNWSWMDRMVKAAEKFQLKLYLDIWHYGYPDWFDILSPEAPQQFADFCRQIALRYPSIEYYCVANEPSLLLQEGGRAGKWGPYLNLEDVTPLRQQISRMIIQGSKEILNVKPNAFLIIPEPWHATDRNCEENQAAILDTVLGLRDPELGGCHELVTIIGLNHYRDSTLPPFHRLIMNAQKRWPTKQLWITETSGPPDGWAQAEWFWWMMAEVRLACMSGVNIPVFTWAPAISMYDWIDETRQLHNGIWIIKEDGSRAPNGKMIEAIELAREYDYLI